MGAADTPQSNDAALAFIRRWQNTTASELSTAQSFLRELCGLLGVENPHATAEQHYMFERPITFHHGDGSTSAGRIDCYRRGAFVLEAKKVKAGPQTKVLATQTGALPVAEIETRFKGRGPWKRSLPRILDTLEALGRARREGDAWRAG